MRTESKKNIHIIRILLCLLGIVATYYITSLFLKNYFQDSGEAYHKGFGHLLQENFWKGVFFIAARHLTVTVLMFTIIFNILNDSGRKLMFKILVTLSILTMVVIFTYAGIKIYGAREYHRTEDVLHIVNRTTEITITWLLRVSGFFLGYLLTKKYKRKVKGQVYQSS